MKRWLLAMCVTGMLSACATANGSTQPGEAPLALTLARSDGRTIQLDVYAGRPLLLFLFATYDEPSQVALLSLTQLAKEDATLQVAGVLVQPDAETFMPLFKEAVSVPFELYYEPEQHLLLGQSALGKLGAVPAFVVLDAAGRIRETAYGVLKVDEIKQLMRR